MTNFTNLLKKDEGPAELVWEVVDFKDCSEYMLECMGSAARNNDLELYVLYSNSDSIIWAIGQQERKIEWLTRL